MSIEMSASSLHQEWRHLLAPNEHGAAGEEYTREASVRNIRTSSNSRCRGIPRKVVFALLALAAVAPLVVVLRGRRQLSATFGVAVATDGHPGGKMLLDERKTSGDDASASAAEVVAEPRGALMVRASDQIACEIKNMAFEPLDMLGSWPADASTIRECRKLCSANDRCERFTFDPISKLCHLQDDHVSLLWSPPFIAGLRSCSQLAPKTKTRETKSRSATRTLVSTATNSETTTRTTSTHISSMTTSSEKRTIATSVMSHSGTSSPQKTTLTTSTLNSSATSSLPRTTLATNPMSSSVKNNSQRLALTTSAMASSATTSLQRTTLGASVVSSSATSSSKRTANFLPTPTSGLLTLTPPFMPLPPLQFPWPVWGTSTVPNSSTAEATLVPQQSTTVHPLDRGNTSAEQLSNSSSQPENGTGSSTDATALRAPQQSTTRVSVEQLSNSTDQSNNGTGILHLNESSKVKTQSVNASSLSPWSLFCFLVLMPDGYEPDLVRAQVKSKMGVFACDDHLAISTKRLDLGKGANLKTMAPVKKQGIKGSWGSWLNTQNFLVAWDLVLEDGSFRSQAWTVKVDPDCVFFPDRLIWHLKKIFPGGNGTDSPLYIKNCKYQFGLMGSLEIFSRAAIDAYGQEKDACRVIASPNSGEDGFIQACMTALNISFREDFFLLTDGFCQKGVCKDQYWSVGFHPYKGVDKWFQCHWEAMHR